MTRIPYIWGFPGVFSDGETANGVLISRTAAALPQTATSILFTVTGTVRLKAITGIVTTAVGNVANNTKLTHGVTDICAVTSVQNDAIGTRYSITGTFANALVKTAVGVPVAVQATEVVLPPGNLILNCAASDGGGGRVEWIIEYTPLTEEARVVAV